MDDPHSLFEEDDAYTGPDVRAELVERAEAILGVRLPNSYVRLIKVRNGGRLRRRCVPTPFPTSWAPDHFEISALLGIGGPLGIDSEAGSAYLISEWGYPNVGVVIADTPSAGHDTVMLDYTGRGPDGEPAVVYVDEDRVPRRIAETFDGLLALLEQCE